MNIIDNELFQKLPLSAQALYLHLYLRSKDGIAKKPLSVATAIGADKEDFKTLLNNKLIFAVGGHALLVTETELLTDFADVDTSSMANKKIKPDEKVQRSYAKDIRNIMNEWNGLKDLGVKEITGMISTSQRYSWTVTRIKEHGVDMIISAIRRIRNSDFLTGKTKGNFVITYDWFIRPNNFIKVLEGNYDSRTDNSGMSDLERYVKGEERT